MKKILYILTAFSVIGLTSCSKDEGSGAGSDALVGKWECIADYSEVEGEMVLSHQYSDGSYIQFTATEYTSYIKSDVTYGSPYKYTYKSNTITFTQLGLTLKVFKLTNTELETEFEQVNYDIGSGETTRYKGKSTYKKIE